MADTPNKEIEKQLRDYAAKRREAAGSPEMHAATRRMLQAEVKLQQGQQPSPAKKHGLMGLWLRLAAGSLAMALLLGVIVFTMNGPETPEKYEMALAKDKESPPTHTAVLASAPASPKSELAKRGIAMTDSILEPDKNVPASEPKLTQTAPVSAGKASNMPLFNVNRESSDGVSPSLGVAAGSTPMAAAEMPASTFFNQTSANNKVTVEDRTDRRAFAAKGGAVSDATSSAIPVAFANTSTQRFRDSARQQMPRAKAAPVVLDEFTVLQNGNELKIVDRDGSIYNGTVRAAPILVDSTEGVAGRSQNMDIAGFISTTNFAAAQTKIEKTDRPGTFAYDTAQSASEPSNDGKAWNGMQNYYFEVEGTNRSLQERVVFSGNLVQTVRVGFKLSDSDLNKQTYRQENDQHQAVGNAIGQQLENNYINGKAYLGESKSSIEVNAVPVNP